ncbi:MAG: hypothetical protein EA422_05885 [Gemmatimonadales bacterium]|nr:MAG: hypothetical protein EA422_05885 [Gemmatimonadales bacterium]
MVLALVVTVPALLVPVQGGAQLTGDPGVPPSIRSLGLGGALPLADRDPDLLFGNPALVERARGSGVAAGRLYPEVGWLSMAAATAWWGGGAGLGVRVWDGGAAAGGVDGVEGAPGGEGTTVGAVTAGLGRTVKGIRVGAALTGMEARRGEARDATAHLDLGVAAEVGPVTLGVSGGGLGPSLELPPSGDRLHPRWARAGFGTTATPLGPLDVAAMGGLTVRQGYRPRAGIGVEVGWWPVAGRTFVGRAGLESGRRVGTSPWSMGGAFLGDSFTLEYGVRPRSDGGRVHGVALRFR